MSAELAFESQMPGVSPEVYNPSDFAAVAEIAKSEAGIILPEGKAMLVYSRLAPLVRESGLGTFDRYIAHIREDEADKARAVAALTTNHTFFYRESHHFEFFEREVRPALLQRLHAGEAIRLWSAGCSSGEETWSLILTLLGRNRSEGLDIIKRDIRVLASDLAPHAAKAAEAGEYERDAMDKVPGDMRRLWSRDQGELAIIGDEARSIARFRLLNLLRPWPMTGQFQVIFCRNVVIYFDTPTKQKLTDRFVDALAPGGFLFVGHSERVTGPAADRLVAVGPTIYRKRGDA